MFWLGYRHCFTVDENLICATERETASLYRRTGDGSERGTGRKERKQRDKKERRTESQRETEDDTMRAQK